MPPHFCSFSTVVEKFLVATSKVFGLHDQLNNLSCLMNWDVIWIECPVHYSDPKPQIRITRNIRIVFVIEK